MTPRELRATLDCLDLSAAEAGHLLGVHRATVYRWLDGSTSVPIVVELLLRLMVRRGIRPTEVTASRHGRTSAKPRSGRSQAKSTKRIVHPMPSYDPKLLIDKDRVHEAEPLNQVDLSLEMP